MFVVVLELACSMIAYDGPVSNHILAEHRRNWINACVMEEGEHYFQFLWHITADTELMQERLAAMGPTTPPFNAQYALPSLTHCYECISDCRRFLRWLDDAEKWVVGDEQKDINEMRADVEYRLSVWEKIRDCRGYSCGRKGRRLELQELRDAMPEAFDTGRWLNPLPDWAYNNVWKLEDSVNDDEG